MCCVCKLDIWLLQLTDPETLVQRQKPCMGRDGCGHLCRKSLHSQCRYTRQCINWCWDRQMPSCQLLFSTSCNRNHWCVWQVHCPLLPLSCLAKKLVGISGDPREGQWLHQRLSLAVVRGNTASILACVQVWSDFSHPQCINQCSCPSLASLRWIAIAFRMSVFSVSFIVLNNFIYSQTSS